MIPMGSMPPPGPHPPQNHRCASGFGVKNISAARRKISGDSAKAACSAKGMFSTCTSGRRACNGHALQRGQRVQIAADHQERRRRFSHAFSGVSALPQVRPHLHRPRDQPVEIRLRVQTLIIGAAFGKHLRPVPRRHGREQLPGRIGGTHFPARAHGHDFFQPCIASRRVAAGRDAAVAETQDAEALQLQCVDDARQIIFQRGVDRPFRPRVDLPCPRLSTPTSRNFPARAGVMVLKSSIWPKPPCSRSRAGAAGSPFSST